VAGTYFVYYFIIVMVLEIFELSFWSCSARKKALHIVGLFEPLPRWWHLEVGSGSGGLNLASEHQYAIAFQDLILLLFDIF
jgi:hypothetical protein